MTTIKQINSLDYTKVKTVVISPSPPKFSEVWMSRINEMLSPEILFICLAEKKSVQGSNDYPTVLLSKNSFFPNRFHLYFNEKKIKEKIFHILDRVPNHARVLCHYLTTAVYLGEVFHKINKKIFVYCHGHDVTWNRKVEAFPFIPAHGFGYQKNVKKLIGNVDLIANSKCTMKKLKHVGFERKSIHLNYLSVDISQLRPIAKSTNAILNVLYLGRLTDFKGPLETIEAFELARKMSFKGNLHIVGDGIQMKRCLKKAAGSEFKNDIFIHGPVGRKEALEFFKKADIFTAHNKTSISTGQEEAFGVSIIEAMAFGLPVVTGSSGGVIETVVNGETGILFNPGDIHAHANAFVRLAENEGLRRRMGKAGRKRAIEFFNAENDKINLVRILHSK
jgi:glycosyltransferase involved in cell wall biosynthesis